ncbi:blue light regulator 1 [Delitschia confertaspora ATCC 74209]|uniref:Blue light regulator 1 n=1 Tax=Delitschia confertaspora ATCC 74209 TaxID=1513339 RepID=A0A9P4JHZ5_9PLEO|nr:blue light regulator 1 [Delitschia confertaspora ATCC 74209]
MSRPQDGMGAFNMGEGQSLDEIVSQNENAARRRSMPVSYMGNVPMQISDADSRRLSMMDFDPSSAGNFDDFQFSMPPGASMEAMMRTNPAYPRDPGNAAAGRSGNELGINTQFVNQNMPFSTLAPPGSAYASPLHPTTSLNMDMAAQYAGAMSMPLDMTDPSLSMMGPDMNMFSHAQFSGSMMNSPISHDFGSHYGGQPHDSVIRGFQSLGQYRNGPMNTAPERPSGASPHKGTQEQNSAKPGPHPHLEERKSSKSTPSQTSTPLQSSSSGTAHPPQQHDVPVDEFSQLKFPWETPAGGFPSTMEKNPHVNTEFKNAYSSTGFDMLRALMLVATRKNPEIEIGLVDLSCAFVVCDAQMDDHPIIYCSENFERLTGYSRHDILGRNCRFLQSPDGKVQAGVKRKYVDDNAVMYLKKMITLQREAQISLINYRRGGQPFMNLLTMIPIPWDTDAIRYFIGFQVDLVEQPGSMLNKNPSGSYRVNYQRGVSMPSYIFNPDMQRPDPQLGQTISKDQVSDVLANYGVSGESEITRRIWDKVLLENTDDVVHVLSLKGLFLYLSPSSTKVLEYHPNELVGTALSSVCHPSDIVPVTRELKETANGTSVNVVFRIRRKQSGYMWFEGHGSLHTEQGKGRKCIILVGRERPVYTLSKSIVRESGGVGDNELWTKMSTSGMFLFVSSNVRQLLDKQPEDLVGTSIQALMRQDSRVEFGRTLELTRTGRKGEVKHEMINKRGQVLQAFTTLYPGDATENQKPTFIVAQTRLLKYSRSAHAHRPSIYPKQEPNSGESQVSQASQASQATAPSEPQRVGSDASRTTLSGVTVDEDTGPSVTTFAGQNALAIGHQDHSLASDENVFDELKTTRSSSWQYELRQMEKRNRYLAEEVQSLLAAKKKRKRRKGAGQLQKDCANCHTRTTPEWRRGPSGNRDLCNSCGLRWAKQNGRVSPRTSSHHSDKSTRKSTSPRHTQPILPNTIAETGAQPSIPSTLAPGTLPPAGKRSPHQAMADHHAAKVARMEVAASQGLSGGVPPKIDEGIEPD